MRPSPAGQGKAANLATTVWFKWGTTSSYGQTTGPGTFNNWTGVSHVTAAINGLVANQTCHFALMASNEFGLDQGADQMFIAGGRSTVWGDDNFKQTNQPPALGNLVAVAGGVENSRWSVRQI